MCEFAGFQFDTVNVRLRVLEGQVDKMMVCLGEWESEGSVTARFFAKVRGKTQHFSAGVMYLHVFVAEISLRLGTEASPDDVVSEFDRDKEFPKSAEIIDLAREI